MLLTFSEKLNDGNKEVIIQILLLLLYYVISIVFK